MIEVVETLKQRGVDLWVKNQMIDTSQVGGMLVYNILNSISSYEMEINKTKEFDQVLENWKRKNPDLKTWTTELILIIKTRAKNHRDEISKYRYEKDFTNL